MVISFTPAELMTLILGICSGIVAVSAAVGVIASLVKKAKSPNELQNERLKVLEEKVENHEKLFAKDKLRLDAIEDGNRVTQRAILALLSHGIDGNEIDAMKKAKTELTDYLIRR